MAEFLDKLLPKEIRWENHINQVGKVILELKPNMEISSRKQ
jgi:hypothetical protein